jgi:hypothetical protein
MQQEPVEDISWYAKLGYAIIWLFAVPVIFIIDQINCLKNKQ